jgi:hypothetical protein
MSQKIHVILATKASSKIELLFVKMDRGQSNWATWKAMTCNSDGLQEEC